MRRKASFASIWIALAFSTAFAAESPAHGSHRSAIERTISLTELFASHERYDRTPVIVRAELREMFPHDRLLLDDRCGARCPQVSISFRVPAQLQSRPDMVSLRNAWVDNDHRCFAKLRVTVIYKFARADEPRPPAGLRVAQLRVIDVLALSSRPLEPRLPVRPCARL